MTWFTDAYIDGLVQNCSNSIANALELLQSCTKPLICFTHLSYTLFQDAPYTEVISGKAGNGQATPAMKETRN